ncbi:MAG TPA: Zn-dependent hydrolase [Acetobacteraceae bacterium]|nr:Zn-dependent hydrolase [Acetobacteraceae bacterium]
MAADLVKNLSAVQNLSRCAGEVETRSVEGEGAASTKDDFTRTRHPHPRHSPSVRVATQPTSWATLFETLRTATSDGVGITRESYGPGESLALDIIEAEAHAHGLATERDAGANLVVTLPGRDPALPFLACGSHLDSVPQGGNYDGAAGVIAGLIALCQLHDEGFDPTRTIKLFALRGEESAWFGRAYIGSSSLFGKLTADDLALPNVASGRPLIDCMRDAGVAVDRLARGELLLDPKTVAAWLELHIEQGPVLVARKLPLAIVTGIRGNFRHRSIECLGEAGHSGTIPRWLRRDAVFATADLITRLDRHWRTLLERGRDLVMTSGIIGTDPAEHALARIPGRLRFSFEARSQSTETLEAFYDLFQSECAGIAEERGVRFVFDRRLDSAPARMDETWIARLRAILRDMDLPDEPIASGAGHDAAVFSNAGIPSAMIFVRNEHGSHNPEEAMDMDDFLRGTELLCRALREGSAA